MSTVWSMLAGWSPIYYDNMSQKYIDGISLPHTFLVDSIRWWQARYQHFQQVEDALLVLCTFLLTPGLLSFWNQLSWSAQQTVSDWVYNSPSTQNFCYNLAVSIMAGYILCKDVFSGSCCRLFWSSCSLPASATFHPLERPGSQPLLFCYDSNGAKKRLPKWCRHRYSQVGSRLWQRGSFHSLGQCSGRPCTSSLHLSLT